MAVVAAAVLVMMMMAVDAETDADRADMGADDGGVGRARAAQHREGKH